MRSRSSVVDGESEWLTLGQAQELLGLSSSTLRRWGDSGEVRTFVTPGGHRRFSRSSIEALLPRPPSTRPSLVQLGETSTRMARAYRKATIKAEVPWLERLGSRERSRFRDEGIRTAETLMAAIDLPEGPERRRLIATAAEASIRYGRAAAGAGLSASLTVETFLRFRSPFLGEMSSAARRRDLDAAATAQLIEAATAALDELMVAMLRGWESAPSATRAAWEA
jgi:excisionase family DNA binding protein